jgi:hypothetical protein
MSNKNEDKQGRKMVTQEILEWINKIVLESQTEEMIKLRIEHKMLYIDNMVNKFNEFYDSYSQIFVKVIFPMTDEDKQMLGKILAMHDIIKKKKISKLRGEYIIGEELAQKYAPGLLDPNRVIPN